MKAINIILDETDPTRPTFVEIENDGGASINIGKRKRVHGLTHLRITIADIDLIVPDFAKEKVVQLKPSERAKLRKLQDDFLSLPIVDEFIDKNGKEVALFGDPKRGPSYRDMLNQIYPEYENLISGLINENTKS